ncbi:Uncharacterised protein [uncultured archaeon]|nr:Uncharacterised protein [uncultured archaeon]
MKFTMSPKRAYLLGLWKGRRTKEGIGVEGHHEVCETFLKLCLDEKLCQPDKVKFEEGEASKCYFYNTSVRVWLQEEMMKREERLRFRNEFAANYFAGLFDGKGGFYDDGKEKFCYIIGDHVDEIILLRLGFRVKKERGKIAVISQDFYGWIMPYLKLEISAMH